MPHQCTDCGRTFADGSQEMLSGCPDCGGNKFQYQPEGADQPEQSAQEPPEPPDPPAEGSVARTVGSAATAVRDFVSSGPSRVDPVDSDPDPDTHPGSVDTAPDPDPDSDTGSAGVDSPEDTAQASARTEIVTKDELPPAPETPATADRSTSEDTDTAQSEGADDGRDRPELSELREELNDQFESIKVLDPGKYELNLMELYDREEYIIALQEDGKYTIQVPERWQDD